MLNRLGKAINNSDQDIAEDIFYSNKPIKIITHGWRSSADTQGVINIKNAYLEAQNVNVITLDWSSTAKSILYFWVANETMTVGGQVAGFIEELNRLYNVTSDKIHLIGHSLGAHVMGIAASKINSTVYRVTGRLKCDTQVPSFYLNKLLLVAPTITLNVFFRPRSCKTFF